MFCFNDPATTEIYTLSLRDALPICRYGPPALVTVGLRSGAVRVTGKAPTVRTDQGAGRHSDRLRPRESRDRSEEHTSELQSRQYLVCRLLPEKKTYHLPSRLPRTRS